MSVILNALKEQEKTKKVKAGGLKWASGEQERKRFRFEFRKTALGVLVFCLSSAALVSIYRNYSSETTTAQEAKFYPVISEKEEAKRDYLAEGQIAYGSKEYKKSIMLLKKALAGTPDNWILLNNLGLAQSKNGDLDQASASFFRAISLNTSCASCYNNLGDLELRRGALKDAELYYQKAVSADPSYAAPLFNLGVLYEKIGQEEEAYAAYKDYLELNPEHDSVLYQKVSRRVKQLEY